LQLSVANYGTHDRTGRKIVSQCKPIFTPII